MSLVILRLNQNANVVLGVHLDVFEALCRFIEHDILFARIFQEEAYKILVQRLKFFLFKESWLVMMVKVEIGKMA